MSTIPRTRTPRLDNLQSETAKVERKAKFLKPRKIRKKVLLTPKEKHERFSFDPSRGKRGIPKNFKSNVERKDRKLNAQKMKKFSTKKQIGKTIISSQPLVSKLVQVHTNELLMPLDVDIIQKNKLVDDVHETIKTIILERKVQDLIEKEHAYQKKKEKAKKLFLKNQNALLSTTTTNAQNRIEKLKKNEVKLVHEVREFNRSGFLNKGILEVRDIAMENTLEKVKNFVKKHEEKNRKLFFEKVTPILLDYINELGIEVLLNKDTVALASLGSDITISAINKINEQLKN